MLEEALSIAKYNRAQIARLAKAEANEPLLEGLVGDAKHVLSEAAFLLQGRATRALASDMKVTGLHTPDGEHVHGPIIGAATSFADDPHNVLILQAADGLEMRFDRPFANMSLGQSWLKSGRAERIEYIPYQHVIVARHPQGVFGDFETSNASRVVAFQREPASLMSRVRAFSADYEGDAARPLAGMIKGHVSPIDVSTDISYFSRNGKFSHAGTTAETLTFEKPTNADINIKRPGLVFRSDAPNVSITQTVHNNELRVREFTNDGEVGKETVQNYPIDPSRKIFGLAF